MTTSQARRTPTDPCRAAGRVVVRTADPIRLQRRVTERKGRSLGTALRYQTLLIGAVVGVFLLAGVALNASPSTGYVADTDMFLHVPPNQSQLDNEQLTRFYLNQVTSSRVLQRVSENLKVGATAESLRADLTASLAPGATVIKIRARAATPSEAIALANGVTQAAIEDNQAAVAARFMPRRTYLTGELTRIAGATSAADQNSQGAVALREQYAETFKNLQELSLEESQARDSLTVIDAARVGKAPGRTSYLAASLLLGSIVAVFLALLRDRFDDRIFTTEDLARAAGTSLVIAEPTPAGRPLDAVIAPYTVILSSIITKCPDVRVVMVAAASRHDVASRVARQLGDAARSLGRPALVLLTGEEPGGARSARPGPSYVPRVPALFMHSWLNLRKYLEDARARSASSGEGSLTIVAVCSPLLDPTAARVAALADVGVIVATERMATDADVTRSVEALQNSGLDLVAGIVATNEHVGSTTATSVWRRVEAVVGKASRRRKGGEPPAPERDQPRSRSDVDAARARAQIAMSLDMPSSVPPQERPGSDGALRAQERSTDPSASYPWTAE